MQCFGSNLSIVTRLAIVQSNNDSQLRRVNVFSYRWKGQQSHELAISDAQVFCMLQIIFHFIAERTGGTFLMCIW